MALRLLAWPPLQMVTTRVIKVPMMITAQQHTNHATIHTSPPNRLHLLVPVSKLQPCSTLGIKLTSVVPVHVVSPGFGLENPRGGHREALVAAKLGAIERLTICRFFTAVGVRYNAQRGKSQARLRSPMRSTCPPFVHGGGSGCKGCVVTVVGRISGETSLHGNATRCILPDLVQKESMP